MTPCGLIGDIKCGYMSYKKERVILKMSHQLQQ